MTPEQQKAVEQAEVMFDWANGKTVLTRPRFRVEKEWQSVEKPRWDWLRYEYKTAPAHSVPQELIDQVGEALSAIHIYNMEQENPDHVAQVPKLDYLYDHVDVIETLIDPIATLVVPEDASGDVKDEVRKALGDAMHATTIRAWGPPRKPQD